MTRGHRSRAWLGIALASAFALVGFVRGPLQIGPGSGTRTTSLPMVRPLREDVTVMPIITVGDSLAPPDTSTYPYIFPPEPDGLGIRKTETAGIAEIYVAHEIRYDGFGPSARMSRLALDLRNLGILAGDLLVDGSEGYSRFCAAQLAGSREGFLQPTFLMNEEAVDGPHEGLVVAVEARSGAVTHLPWLGRFAHEMTLILPVSSGKLVAILTEDYYPGESQLYMYLAENDAAFLSGRGNLYVFRGNPPAGSQRTRLASMVTKGRPITGRFVPVSAREGGPWLSPRVFEARAQAAGSTNFVRLEDAAVDRSNANSFFFTDTGSDDFFDPVTGRLVTGKGRLYSMRLDPFDPTRVEELRVLLDGDEGDDIHRPDNIDSDDRYVWIQEDPGGFRGLHPSRILRYDTQGRRVDVMAEVAERDPTKGELLPRGIGGAWESTGILNVSEIFGQDTWLIAVQAHNVEMPRHLEQRGSGQLLLLRGPKAKKPAGSPRSSGTTRESGARPGGCG
ncbi:MAG TPA: alkaline phosphatase PhoX [Candidatus Eisenbacteria bacterium]|nr:alkaline phosphatase PhoX [Candidatus Eisenbacteria bacterium]